MAIAVDAPEIRPDVQPERDPWFDPGLVPGTERLRHVAAGVAGAVENLRAKRALKPQEREKLHDVVARVVADFVHRYRRQQRGYRCPAVQKGPRRQAYALSAVLLPSAVSQMVRRASGLGFARQRRGFSAHWPEKAKRTTIRADAKLIRLIKEHQVSFEDIGTKGQRKSSL